MQLINMAGQKFDKRKVIALGTKIGTRGERFWLVQCDCGRKDEVSGVALRSGQANQCKSCIGKSLIPSHTTHGFLTRTHIPKEYNIWAAMKDRCVNFRNRKWHLYGGRGIKVCDRWMHNFELFFADMGPKPKGKSIDRINNDGNYEPGNCRWATSKEQRSNQRKHGLIEIFTNEELLTELKRRKAI